MDVSGTNLRFAGHMRVLVCWLGLLALVGLSASTASHAASLDPVVLPKIQAATFEVVAAKPVNDPLT